MKCINTELHSPQMTKDILIDILYDILCKDSHEGEMNRVNMLKYLVEKVVGENDNNDFLGIFGKEAKASSAKKIVFERYLEQEGFNEVHWVGKAETDKIFREQDLIPRKIAIKHDNNVIAIIAPFYSSSEKNRCMNNDRYQWDEHKRISGSKWIYDVYVYDNMETSFEDLYKFIYGLRAVRWVPVNRSTI